MDLSEGWKVHPPLQWMVQSYLGIKPKDDEDNDQEFDRILAQLGATPPSRTEPP